MASFVARSTLKWAAIDQVFRQVLFFAISVAMARLVAPEAYGTIALLHFFTAIASVFTDGGLSSALIQRQNATHTDESTVFWYNLAAGTTMGTLLFISAPWISNFYNVAILAPITQLFSLQFLLGFVNSVQNALF